MAIFGLDFGGSRRYAELITRVFQIESADAPLPPGFILELERPEWRCLKREKMWSTGPVNVAAAVGNLSRMQVAVPVKAGTLAVVLGIGIITKLTQASCTVTLDGPGIVAGIAHNFPLDTRQEPAGSEKVTTTNAIDNTLPAVAGNAIDIFTAVANGDAFSKVLPIMPVVLIDNRRIDIWNRTPNEASTFIAWGYERPATPDELTL